ncbi:solute carrier family 4 member 2, partial [Chelydra serpentina]
EMDHLMITWSIHSLWGTWHWARRKTGYWARWTFGLTQPGCPYVLAPVYLTSDAPSPLRPQPRTPWLGSLAPAPWRGVYLVCPVPAPQRESLSSAATAGITRSKSKHELKLLEKIPDNAEATVVLV